MRVKTATLLLVLCAASSAQQTDIWLHVDGYRPPHVPSVTLSPSQERSVVALLKSREEHDGWCSNDVTGECLKALRFEAMPLSPTRDVILVEAGIGCGRSGQGANGAMWLIRFDGPHPTLLATPEQHFEGFVYSVPYTTNNGYRDIVLGWHMGAGEMPLSYFRYNGKSYRLIGTATVRPGPNGNAEIIVDPRIISH